ncbi:hypothetical protein ABZ729_31745 [Streptomyces sp. NPDC006678]|uniref:hypothetical protein n=1 Tax=Streptomyces sp. NPDC006678 TaxID=3157185 RepID=UPI0033D227AB
MAGKKLLRAAGLTVTAVGAALGSGVGTAQAAPAGEHDPSASVQALADTVGYVSRPVKSVPLNPLAHTGVDPLDNGVGTQVADFKSLDTTGLTGSLGTPGEVPVAGPLLGGLIPG